MNPNRNSQCGEVVGLFIAGVALIVVSIFGSSAANKKQARENEKILRENQALATENREKTAKGESIGVKANEVFNFEDYRK